MLVIPAIDLKDGQCVRLRQGRMDEATLFGDDPLRIARQWVDQGCRQLHLVDLNGAFAGSPVNGDSVIAISKAFPKLPIQIGGGIRSLDTIEHYLSCGVSTCIIGTQALRDPDFVAQACRAFAGHISVGIDAKDGKVAVQGWAEVSDLDALTLAQRFAQTGVNAIIYTDISRDGMMQGVNIAATTALAQQAGVPVIASGGVSQLDDIVKLAQVAHHGIQGVIVGRALYEGQLDLAQAQHYCDHLPTGSTL